MNRMLIHLIKGVLAVAMLLWIQPLRGQNDPEGLYLDEQFQRIDIESHLQLFLDDMHNLSADLGKYPEEKLPEAEKKLALINIRWNVFYAAKQTEIAADDGLLSLITDFQALKQGVSDTISLKKHYFESLTSFAKAEEFIQAQVDVYKPLLTSAKEYSLLEALAAKLDKVKGKEKLLFADVQLNYEMAKAIAQEFEELKPRMPEIEEHYIELKGTSEKIQAQAYLPLFQRIKDYLFGFAAVALILMFFNMVQSKIQMIKEGRKNAEKLKKMTNREDDDIPSI